MRKREGGEEKDDWKRFGTSETCRWSMAEVFRSRDEWKRVRGEDCILIVKCEAEVYKVLAFFYIRRGFYSDTVFIFGLIKVGLT